MCPKKFRIAVPYTDRLFSYPNIGFSSLVQALWDSTDNTCEILKLHESELLKRVDYDAVFSMRGVAASNTCFDHFAKNGKCVAVWMDDLHTYFYRVPCASKKLALRFDHADIVFLPYIQQFRKWKLYRQFENKVVWSPWSVPVWIFEHSRPWVNRKNRILLSGMCSIQYPLRKRLFKYARNNENNFLDSLHHPGYASANKNKGVTGKDYYILLGMYKGAIATTASKRAGVRDTINYTLLKYFEIPACGCVPFMEVTPDLEELGFVDGMNFISITRSNYEKRLRFIHSKEARGVAKSAYDLVLRKHTHKHRVQLILDSITNLLKHG